jgi:hypothetical protein
MDAAQVGKWHARFGIQVRLQSYIRPTSAELALRGPDEIRRGKSSSKRYRNAGCQQADPETGSVGVGALVSLGEVDHREHLFAIRVATQILDREGPAGLAGEI